MNRYKHLLVAVDFSEHATRAIERAIDIAKSQGADLTLLHITEIPVYPTMDEFAAMGVMTQIDVEIAAELEKQANLQLEHLAQKLKVPENTRLIVRQGIVKNDILETAEEVKADLIVMGRHGLSGIKALIGSVTDSVIHGAQCDVLAVTLD